MIVLERIPKALRYIFTGRLLRKRELAGSVEEFAAREAFADRIIKQAQTRKAM